MSSLHDQIGKRALELLPQWEYSFWKSEAASIPEYCFYPDRHLEAVQCNKAEADCYGKYCIMPNGRCIPHGPVDSNGINVVLSEYPLDFGITDEIVIYYLKKIVSLIENGNVTESARFAGAFAHFIQDSCISVHVVNNLMINALFPSSNGKYFFYHRLVDKWPFHPERVNEPPKLLGRTIDEASFAISERVRSSRRCALGYLVPFLSAIQTGCTADADYFSQLMNAEAIKFTADIWHTLFCLAFRHFSSEECRNLLSRSLTDAPMLQSNDSRFNREQFVKARIPFYDTVFPDSDPCRSRLSTDPYPYEPEVDFAYDGKGNLIPLALKIGGRTIQHQRGIAVGGYGIATYRVPGNLFFELDVYAGVHPQSSSSQEITFAIWCYELQTPLLASGNASRNTEALHFVVKLPECCRTISLISAGGNRDTSAIWLNPVIKSRM